MSRWSTASGKVRPELAAEQPMLVRDLIELLRGFNPEAEIAGSFRGGQVPRVYVGVGLGPTREPCVIVSDREAFAGRLPDMLLER